MQSYLNKGTRKDIKGHTESKMYRVLQKAMSSHTCNYHYYFGFL